MTNMTHFLSILSKPARFFLYLGFAVLIMLLHQGAAASTPSQFEMAAAELLGGADSMRVIVQLDMPFVPEGELQGIQQLSQQQTIDGLQSAVVNRVQDAGGELLIAYETIPYLAMEVDAASLEALLALPEVAAVQEDIPVPPALTSSTPVIGADTAWSDGYTGAGQTVAILDTGVDTTHAAFTTGGSRIVAEACFSSDSTSSFTVCPNGAEQQVGAGAGRDCTAEVAGYPNAQGDCQHGTHVASIAAGDDGANVVGVAPEANIIAVQVFSFFPSYGRMMSYSTDQMAGLEYIYTLKDSYDIAAVNMSLGGSPNSGTCDLDLRKSIIDNLASAGIATVVAAGNDQSKTGISAPGCISSAISVGATTDGDEIASYSNISPEIDLLAPGSNIYAAVPGSYGYKSGTSMATPHVAGAWALFKEAMPDATVETVLNALQESGTLVDDLRSGGVETDMPRINIDTAITAYATPPAALQVSLTAEDEYALPGGEIVYTAVVQNSSDQTAVSPTLQTTIPTDTRLKTAALDGDPDYDGTTPGSSVTWALGAELAPGASTQRTFTLTVDANAVPSQLEVSASANADNVSAPVSDEEIVTIHILLSAEIDPDLETEQNVPLAADMGSLNIPPGALPEEAALIEFLMEPEGVSSVGDDKALIFTLNLRDDNGDLIAHPTFSPPLQLTFHYDEQILAAAGVESLLTFQYYNEQTLTWELMSITERDLDGDCLIIELPHFSQFAVMGPQQTFLPFVVNQ